MMEVNIESMCRELISCFLLFFFFYLLIGNLVRLLSLYILFSDSKSLPVASDDLNNAFY